MTNHSYYDDIAAVRDILHRASSFKESSEIIYEQYQNLEKAFNEFKEVSSTLLPSDAEFIRRYGMMTSAYKSFEFHAGPYDEKCKKTVANRLRVSRAFYALTNKQSFLVKSKFFLGMENVSPESISMVSRLAEEAGTIGFSLDIEERDTILMLEDMFNKI